MMMAEPLLTREEAAAAEQNTEDWLNARLGFCTASPLEKVMAKGRGGQPSKVRQEYMTEIVLERITGKMAEQFENADTRRGHEYEPLAREQYQVCLNIQVDQLGFIWHPSIPWFGASPDGQVTAKKGLEIKSPRIHNHWGRIDSRKIERGYLLQCQGVMACTGWDVVDFVDFNPEYPGPLQMLIIPVKRDAKLIDEIEDEVRKFLKEAEAMEYKMRVLIEQSTERGYVR